MGELYGGAPASQDFYKARQQASLEEILARLTGKPADLLCYPDIREQLSLPDTFLKC